MKKKVNMRVCFVFVFKIKISITFKYKTLVKTYKILFKIQKQIPFLYYVGILFKTKNKK